MRSLNKKFRAAFIISLISLFFFSCGNKNKNVSPADETKGLTMVQQISNSNYTYIFYTDADSLILGYNNIFIQIKDNSTGQFVNNATLSWTPVMQMPTMSHSCPRSAIQKVANKQTLYNGYIIFQMAGTWKLALNSTIDGQSETDTLQNMVVPKSAQYQTRVQSFTGNDGKSYILAMVKPTMSAVNVGTNTLTAYLYTTQDKQTFTPVTNNTIKICPTMSTMPEMGFPGSPNNKDMVFNSAYGLYQGLVNFNMGGYWKISMQLVDSNGNLIYGDEVISADGNNLYFEVNI